MQWFLRFLAHAQSVVKRKDSLGNTYKENAQKNQSGHLRGNDLGELIWKPAHWCYWKIPSNAYDRLQEQSLFSAYGGKSWDSVL